MKYILDLSKTTRPEFSEKVRNFKFPFKTGIHEKDLDMIECDVPKDFYQEIVDRLADTNTSMPIGLDLTSMTPGAVLTVCED